MKASRIWVVLLLAVLAGCATGPGSSRNPLPETIGPDDGIVVVKLIGLQSLSAFNSKWSQLRVTDPKGTSHGIYDSSPNGASYSLFLSTLPKGQYRFELLESTSPSASGLAMALLMTDSIREFPQLGGFTVAPGAVTNLGTIVFAFPKDGKGPPLSTAVLDDQAGKAAALDGVRSDLQPRLAGRPQGSWDNDPDDRSNAAALALIRKHSARLSPMERTRDGRLIAGGPLGQVHERRTNGTWESRSVGALDTITYARALDDGRIFAGTDNGRYYLWQPAQRSWQRFDLPERDTVVQYFEPLGDAGYVMQLGRLGGQMGKTDYLFKARLEEAGGEKTLHAFDGFSAVGRSPLYFNGEELILYFNHPGITRSADVHRINPRTGEKKMDNVRYWVKDVYRLPDGSLVQERMSGLLSVYPMFSKDNGRTWQDSEVEAPGVSRFVDERNGYGFKTSAMGWSSVTLQMNRTQDGGKTWEPTGTPVVATGQSRIQPGTGGELVVYSGQQVLSTRDAGNTWRVEWPQP